MIPWTLAQVAEITGGRVADDVPGAADVVLTGPAFIDSREVVPGGLFTAFAGERVDGHEYAAAAVAAGAAAVLGSRQVGVPAVLVDDPREALQALARRLLAELTDLTVVGLTGSQGKTTTKDMLAVVLASAGATVATQGSFNNELGLPLTVLRADADTRFLVLEMGARGVGHLRELCRIARPDVSLVLNVGKAHLGEFGTQDDIALAKGELVEALSAEGVAVLNADDARVRAMATRTEARVVSFGRGADADVRLEQEQLRPDGCPAFRLVHGADPADSAEVRLQLLGAHQASNAAAAAAVAIAVGMRLPDAAAALGEVTSLSRWRMELQERADGLVVLNDAYNASPDSMAAALQALVAIARGREARPVAVLGEMRELGESTAEEHRGVGRLAVDLGVTRVVGVGPVAEDIVRGAEQALVGRDGEEPVRVDDNEAAISWLRDHVGPGDVVLVKASRGAVLDQVAEALLGLTGGERR